MKKFDPAAIYAGSNFDLSSPEPVEFPPPVRSAYRNYAAVIGALGFPCFFARAAQKQDRLVFQFPGKAGEHATLDNLVLGLTAYLAMLPDMPKMQAAMTVFNVIFDSEPIPLLLEAYQAQCWGTLQSLHDNDTAEWPADVPTEPDDPRWSFCFAGVPIFINMSCPAHVKRRSRNLGPSLTLVINPRDAFDAIAGADPKGTRVRSHIRSLVAKFDSQEPSPELSNYGDPGAREWLQYVLPEDNAPRVGKCPLAIRTRRCSFAGRKEKLL